MSKNRFFIVAILVAALAVSCHPPTTRDLSVRGPRFEPAVQPAVRPAVQPMVFRPAPMDFFYTYLKDYPRDRQTDWSGSLQGVAHDDDHWYFTQALEDGERGYLMKFPMAYDLTRGVPSGATGYGMERGGVRCISKASIPGNPLGGWWHFGDLVHQDGFLFVPVENSYSAVPSMIAVFLASDLSYVGRQLLDPTQTRAGWCAILPGSDRLYVPRSDTISEENKIYVYRIRFDALTGAVRDRRPCLDFLEGPVEQVTLLDECGRPHNLGAYCQGGEFAEDGSLLFLVNGRARDHSGGEGAEGVTIFDARTWKKVSHSRNGGMMFDYKFQPGSPYWEEPEGLTWWDLDAHPRRSEIPGEIEGQLHVLLIDSLGNEYFFKHYRVDPLNALWEETLPFDWRRASVNREGRDAWRIEAGGTEILRFRSEGDADRALEVIRHYRMDSVGFVGGQRNPSVKYFLVEGRAPAGPFPDENCFWFDPTQIRLKRGSGGWRIVDEGTHARGEGSCGELLFFPDRESYDAHGVVETEARTAFKVLSKHGFTYLCHIGPWPNASWIYFRR
jgi:hypothetical protein